MSVDHMNKFIAMSVSVSPNVWLDGLVEAVGYPSSRLTRRQKLLALFRLLPWCEHNYLLIHLIQERKADLPLEAYAVPPEQTTVETMFGTAATGWEGVVHRAPVVTWSGDALRTLLADHNAEVWLAFCQGSGVYAYGGAQRCAPASQYIYGTPPASAITATDGVLALFGDVTAWQVPSEIARHIAVLDQVHAYLPWWEMPALGATTSEQGLTIRALLPGYCQSVFLRNDIALFEDCVEFGRHLNVRDIRAVRKTIVGLIKLLAPHQVVAKPLLHEMVALALEMRRRVKECLRSCGSFAHYRTALTAYERTTRVAIPYCCPMTISRGERNEAGT